MSDQISMSSSMKTPDGIVYRDLQGEAVLLNLNTGTYFGLDPVGTRIWNLLQEQRSLQQILDCLLQEYDVTEAQCREDLLNLIGQMQEKGLVEVSNGKAP
jgi:hypothetical protein